MAQTRLTERQLIADVLTGTEHTAIGDAAPHHAAVTIGADAGVLLDLTGQLINLDSQNANLVFAGPATGAATDPTFRALVAADIAGLAPPGLANPTGTVGLTVVNGAAATGIRSDGAPALNPADAFQRSWFYS